MALPDNEVNERIAGILELTKDQEIDLRLAIERDTRTGEDPRLKIQRNFNRTAASIFSGNGHYFDNRVGLRFVVSDNFLYAVALEQQPQPEEQAKTALTPHSISYLTSRIKDLLKPLEKWISHVKADVPSDRQTPIERLMIEIHAQANVIPAKTVPTFTEAQLLASFDAYWLTCQQKTWPKDAGREMPETWGGAFKSHARDAWLQSAKTILGGFDD